MAAKLISFPMKDGEQSARRDLQIEALRMIFGSRVTDKGLLAVVVLLRKLTGDSSEVKKWPSR